MKLRPTKKIRFPIFLKKDKLYAVKFVTDEEQVDCWMFAFPFNLDFELYLGPYEKAQRFDYYGALKIKNYMQSRINEDSLKGMLCLVELTERKIK
jgi:hypothetical protein